MSSESGEPAALSPPGLTALRFRFASRAAAFEVGLIALGFLVLWFFLPHWPYADDWIRLDDLRQLIDNGHLTNSPFSLAGPLLSAPFIEIAEQFGTPWYMADHFNVIVTGVGVVAAYRLLRGRVDPRLFRRTVLLILFASLYASKIRDFDQVITTTVLMVVGGLTIAFGRRPWLGWAAIVWATVNTPASFGALALIVAVLTWQTRRLRNLLPLFAAAVLFGIEAWVRRGSPFASGDVKGGFNHSVVPGIVDIIFSPGRGLLFYIPALFFFLGSRTRSLVPGKRFSGFMLLYVAGLILVYAKWYAWYGGQTWGPRFFTFAAVPASLFLGVRLLNAGRSAIADVVTLGVLLLSGWIAFDGGTFDLDQLPTICQGQTYPTSSCLYQPEHSSLWAPFVSFPRLGTGAAIFSVYVALVIAYLAAPLIASLTRAVAQLARTVNWRAGWRI